MTRSSGTRQDCTESLVAVAALAGNWEIDIHLIPDQASKV
jgi:hypothetical protein